MMKTELKDGRLVLIPEGRIDTSNAPEFEKEALAALAENPDLNPVIDAAGLTYISSAGLRVLMKLRKAAGKPLAMENVTQYVYAILETTGFTSIVDVKEAGT